jgi:hypothetical protein
LKLKKQNVYALCHMLWLTVACLVANYCWAAPVAYTDEAKFLSALAESDLAAEHEGFEDDLYWGDVRSNVPGGFNTASSITHLGLIWTANNLSSGITTSNGPARTGSYGFYSYPHGSYTSPDPGADCYAPGDCGDGFRGAAENGLIYAIGGYLDTNTPYAKLGLFLGVYPENPVDFGETCDPQGSENCTGNSTIGTQPQFFGVIDPSGFERFEYRELEGKLELGGGDIKYIFADDFYFVVSNNSMVFEDGFESTP